MTIEHAGPFLESGLFSGARANVLMVLCNYADDYGECWPSHEAIAVSARCARETAQREVAWLAAHQCLDILRGSDRPEDKRKIARRANVYRVNLRLVETLYAVMREIKRAAGREPGKRYAAVRIVARWAEKTITESGADVLIKSLRQLIAEGDVTSLLHMGNSDERSHLNDTKCDIEDAKCDATSHKPSIEPPFEPSADFPDGENRKDADGSDENPAVRERRQAGELKVLIGWLVFRSVERLDALAMDGKGRDYWRDKADRLALAIDGPMRRKAESWVGWAQAIIDKTDNGAKPTAGVLKLVDALQDAIVGAGVQARCDLMIADSAAKGEHSRDGPDGDNQQSEDTGEASNEQAA
jgi:hypothetical protein